MNWKRLTLAAAAASAAALTAVVTAFGAGTIHVAGESVFDSEGACDEIPSVFTMQVTGDLVGCWYTHEFEVVQETPSGVYMERGTERFIGCLADGVTCGTFDTTYKFTAKFASDGSEIHGRCQHPITFGTGDFAGIKGRIDFKDDVSTGIFHYRGHFSLPNAAPLVAEAGDAAAVQVAKAGC
jgi:hypothetical protein